MAEYCFRAIVQINDTTHGINPSMWENVYFSYPARCAVDIHCDLLQLIHLKACPSYSQHSTAIHASDLRSDAVNICRSEVIHGLYICA